MKRRILSVTLALMLCVMMALSVNAAPDVRLVADQAGLLTESEADALNTRLQDISSEYDAQIVVMTVDTLGDTDIDEVIEYVYDEAELGYGEDRDGVLLLVSMDPREFRILTNGMADDAIGSSGNDDISDLIVSDLSDGNYADAFDSFADRCEYYLDGHVNGFPFQVGKNLLIALAIGLVVGLIVALILRGQLKSVYKQNEADEYVKPGSMHLTASNDFFLYRTIDRRKKESSSSSSSGSSRSVGGGSF